ncbi:uncharacterized protein PAC_17566 [Phialocephala subalpina]|uniref:C2H2-type domain-containing protein n=1 Tax=Phialocephala subalpina TaxID=576137 RepID=A0A1L7XRV6_9HELO|nr:uncharacterized protein PAC_17566 [Phialocephala subalpina]
MATQPEPMIAWMLAKLKQAGSEGFPIHKLFDDLRQLWSLDRQTVGAQWQALIQQEDVISLVHGAQLSQTPLRKLSLEDLEDLNLSGNKICHKGHHDFTSAQSSTPVPQPQLEEQGSRTGFRSTGPVVFPPTHHTPNGTGDVSFLTNGSLAPQHQSSPGESSHLPPSSATTPSSPQSIPAVKKRMGRAPKTRDNEPPKQSTAPSGPKKLMGRPPKNRATPVPTSSRLQQEPAIGNNAIPPLPITDTNGTIASNPDLSTTSLETPPRARMRVNSSTTSSNGEETPLRIKLNLNTMTPTNGNTSIPHPQDGDERPIREAVYTSHEEMQYQEGAWGVYTGLPSIQRPDTNLEVSRTVVFKYGWLKDPTWLLVHRDCWRLRFAEVSKKDKDDVEQRTKRAKRDQSGRVRNQSGRRRTQPRSTNDAGEHGEEEDSTPFLRNVTSNKIPEREVGDIQDKDTAGIPRLSTPTLSSLIPATHAEQEDDLSIVRPASPIIISPPNPARDSNASTPVKAYTMFQVRHEMRRKRSLQESGSTPPNVASPAPMRDNGSRLSQRPKSSRSTTPTPSSQTQEQAARPWQTPPQPPPPQHSHGMTWEEWLRPASPPAQHRDSPEKPQDPSHVTFQHSATPYRLSMESTQEQMMVSQALPQHLSSRSLPESEPQSISAWPPSTLNQSQWANRSSYRSLSSPVTTPRATLATSPPPPSQALPHAPRMDTHGTPVHSRTPIDQRRRATPRNRKKTNTGIGATSDSSGLRSYLSNPLFEQPRPYSSPYGASSNTLTIPQTSAPVNAAPRTVTQPLEPLVQANTPQQLARSRYQHKEDPVPNVNSNDYVNEWTPGSQHLSLSGDVSLGYQIATNQATQHRAEPGAVSNIWQPPQFSGPVYQLEHAQVSQDQQGGQMPQAQPQSAVESPNHGHPQQDVFAAQDVSLDVTLLSSLAAQIEQRYAAPSEGLPDHPLQASIPNEDAPANVFSDPGPTSTPAAVQQPRKPARSRKRKFSTPEISNNDPNGPSEAKTPKQRKPNTPRQKAPFIGPRAPTDEDRFAASLVAAEQIPVPEEQTRLACVFNNQAGNLILSTDLTTLEFIGVEQRPAELPVLMLPVDEISEHPITSARGSNPMQLRIKRKDPDGGRSKVFHAFVYADSAASHDAASKLREKIVLGMVAEGLKSMENYQQPAELEVELSKPYQCSKCGSRFRQSNGLEYHVSKSQTTCNPNWDPSIPKRRGGPKPNPDKKLPGPRAPRKPKVDRSIEVDSEDPDDEQDDKSESGSSSEDSVIAWAEQTAGAKRQMQAPKKKSAEKVYKAFNNESDVLQDIIDNIATMSEDVPDEVQLPTAMPLFPFPVRDLAYVAAQIQDKQELTQTLCEEMMMALLNANYGMFPSWKSLWMSCVGLWLKKHPNPEQLPKSTLCSKALDHLVDQRKIKLSEYTFVDRKGRLLKTSLVFDPALAGPSLSGDRYELLKNLVRESHPRVYVPSYLAPHQRVLDTLQALVNRAIILPQREVESEEEDDDEEDFDTMIFDSKSPDSQVIMEEEEYSEDEFQDEDHRESSEDENLDVDVEMSDLLGTEPSSHPASRPPTSAAAGRRKSIDPNTRAKISESVHKYHSRVRAGGITHTHRPNPPRPRRVPAVVQTTPNMWQSAPSFMPNPETGAWDVATLPPTSIPEKKVATIGVRYRNYNKTRLPEPITFMQAMDGSWSVRPFGHGVTPIYCRPGRATHGNPLLDRYLKKRDSGHRPVIYPTKNLTFGPNIPSKKFLAKMANGTPVNLQLTISPRPSPQKRKRRESVQDITEYPAKRSRRKIVEEDDGESDFEVTTKAQFDRSSLLPDTRPKRRRRVIKAPEVEVAEVEEAAPPEPKKLEPGAPRNPGLETIPPRFGFCPVIYEGPDIDTLDFPKKYFSVIWTDQKVMGVDPESRIECSWTVRELQTAGEPFQVQWNDDFAFTSETLPYLDLKADNYVPPEEVQQEQPEVIDRSHRYQINGQSNKHVSRKEKLAWTRSQLALPQDFYGIFDDPKEAARVFRTQVTEPNEQSRKRQRLAESVLNTSEENRLIVAVTIIRILTGGLDQTIDWVLVASIFQNYSMNFLEKFWKRIIAGKESMMEDLGRSFQRAYPDAYAKGKVPEFNFDTLVDNDWNGLIDWVLNTIPSPLGNRAMFLPPTRDDLEDYYNMIDVGGDDDWRESYFSLITPVYKRLNISGAEPSVLPVIPHRIPSDDLELEKSWVRAVALTPDDHWDQEAKIAGSAKLGSLGLRTVDRALRVLLNARVLKHVAKDRATPGRSYEATDLFWQNLRRHLKEDLFIEAVTYKRWMDQQFRSGVPALAVDYMGNEGTVMALTSLQAAGRISIECMNVPMEKFGLMEEGYETKKIPREKLTFDMVIKPTSTYIYDDENTALQKIMSTPPPNEDREDEDGKIAAWYGISRKVILELWKRVIMGVSQTLALRAGINIAGLTKIFSPTLEAWELRLLMDWGVEVGLFEKLSPNVEGWMVGEWWWVVVGQLCTM